MARHPVASLLSLLSVSCIAAPIADDAAETDQVEEWNYAVTANKDAWTEHLTSPLVDTIVLEGWDIDPGGPGCAVGLVQGDETIYLKGYGMASASQPWDYRTAAPVGSIAKTITALSLRRLDQEMAGLEMTDTLGQYLNAGVLDDVTLLALLAHEGGASEGPQWEPWSYAATCVGDCEAEKWALTHPRDSLDQMDDGWDLLTEEKYSNVGYTALGALIDEHTHAAPWLFPSERGYEGYTWHRVGRFKGNDTYKGQMLTLALTHSWRVAEHDIPLYARGYEWGGAPADAWDTVDGKGVGFEGWEGPSGGWVMTVGDLARLIESFAKDDIVGELTSEMTVKNSDVLGGYGQGVAVENIPFEVPDDGPGQGGGGAAPPPGEDEPAPDLGDELWWHGGDIGGHVAVWAYWPNLSDYDREPLGVALVCNKRDDDHSAAAPPDASLLHVAREIKDLYVTTGITVWNDLDINGLATADQVDGQDYDLDLAHARIIDPPSFYVPLDMLRESLFVSVDDVGRGNLTLSLVQGESPDDEDATVTPLGTYPYLPGKILDAGMGAGTTVTIDEMGTYELDDVRLRTGFANEGKHLAETTLSFTLDVRQLDDQADDGWVGICTDLARETSCKPCADGQRACLDVTIGYLGSDRVADERR